jgi:hypothetical protein
MFKIKWTHISEKQYNEIKNDNSKKGLFKQIKKTIKFLSINPRHQSLNTHEYETLTQQFGQKVFVAYIQNQTPSAYRLFFNYSGADTSGRDLGCQRTIQESNGVISPMTKSSIVSTVHKIDHSVRSKKMKSSGTGYGMTNGLIKRLTISPQQSMNVSGSKTDRKRSRSKRIGTAISQNRASGSEPLGKRSERQKYTP